MQVGKSRNAAQMLLAPHAADSASLARASARSPARATPYSSPPAREDVCRGALGGGERGKSGPHD